MDSNNKIAALAKLKSENPEKFMQVIKKNLGENDKFQRMTGALLMERVIGREDWSYVILDFPIEVGKEGKATLDIIEDSERAMQLYQELNKKGIDRAISIIHVSRRIAEELRETDDFQEIFKVMNKYPGEKKVLLCNKDISSL